MFYRFSLLPFYVFTAFCCFAQQKYSVKFEDEKLLLKDSIPYEKSFSMLYFHFKGCPGCVQMDKTALADSAVVTFLNTNFHNYSINTLSKEGMVIKEMFQVGPQPDFVIIDRKKQQLHRICGPMQPADFLRQLQYAISSDKSLKKQKEDAKQKEKDYVFMEWHIRNLDVANALDSATIAKGFNAFPEQAYKDSLFVHFFMDFAVYDQRAVLDFQSAPYQFMLKHPELLYTSFDSSRVSYVLIQIAGRQLGKALAKKDEHKYLEAKEVISTHWRDNVYFIPADDGVGYKGIVFSYYEPLQNERDYQYYFKKDIAAYERVESEFFEKIKNSYQALYFMGAVVNIHHKMEEEKLTRRLSYINQAISINPANQVYVMKGAILYMMGNKEDAGQAIKKIKPKDVSGDPLAKQLYDQLTKALKIK
ncbi:MAG: hypothetical protein ACT6QS_14765 [Flavobacteriales bacterium]